MPLLKDYYTAEGGIVTVNTETAKALNIDTAVFKDFGDVVEVKTTEDQCILIRRHFDFHLPDICFITDPPIFTYYNV